MVSVRKDGAVCASLVMVLWAVGVCLAEDIEAITRPSGDVTLSFVRPGRIAKVFVKDGQEVKADSLLIQQDDAAEQAQLAQLKAQAGDRTRIKAAEAQLAQKKVDLQKFQWAAKRFASTELEVEHARLDVTIGELSLELAKFQHEQDKRKYEEVKIQIERMRLTSPIAGRVERVVVKAGESVDALEKVIRIVDIDPLWLEVPVPLERARALKPGRSAKVSLGKSGKKVAGRIIYVASVADAASETLLVRVEVPNPSRRPAGERAFVSFNGSGGKADESEPAKAHLDSPKTDKKE